MLQHIGFIMDGNRTWARENHLPQLEGHQRGYENAKKIINLIRSRGDIAYMGLWALSDDNIRERSPEEIAYLFRLLTVGILDIAKDAKKRDIRIVVVGDRGLLPENCAKNIEKAEQSTETCKSMTVILAIGYGGQDEIARAVSNLAKTGQDMTTITREDILSSLETAKFPPPDMIVRTGGHMRHSGYFLYQSPYAEYYFSDLNWPDFDADELDRALESYESRVRKFGK